MENKNSSGQVLIELAICLIVFLVMASSMTLILKNTSHTYENKKHNMEYPYGR